MWVRSRRSYPRPTATRSFTSTSTEARGGRALITVTLKSAAPSPAPGQRYDHANRVTPRWCCTPTTVEPTSTVIESPLVGSRPIPANALVPPGQGTP